MKSEVYCVVLMWSQYRNKMPLKHFIRLDLKGFKDVGHCGINYIYIYLISLAASPDADLDLERDCVCVCVSGCER